MLLVMFSFFALIIIGSFCHCTNAKAVEGGWSSSEPLHYEQQDARIATLSASEKLSELVFRLDIVECPVAELSQNTRRRYYAHAFYSTSLGKYSCWVFQYAPHQLLFDGNGLLFIKNAKASGKYQNERIELYNIACPENHLGSIVEMTMDLQEREEIGDKSVCLDYVRLEDKDKGTSNEYCGTETVGSNFPKFSSLFVTFRSGFSQTKTGFKIGIICMLESTDANNQEYCLQDNTELSVQDYLEEENFYDADDNKQREAFSMNLNLIPFGTKEKLLEFYKSHYHRGHTSSNEVGSYKRIHSLAQMARNSCDSILAKVAEGVVKIFQEDMAYEHQDSYEDKNDYYT